MSKEKGKKLTHEKFGDTMNKFLEDNEIMMAITSPVGTQKVEIEDNVGAGPTIQVFFLLQALDTAVVELLEMCEKMPGGYDSEKFVDSVMEMVKKDILATYREKKEGKNG